MNQEGGISFNMGAVVVYNPENHPPPSQTFQIQKHVNIYSIDILLFFLKYLWYDVFIQCIISLSKKSR